MNGFLMSQFHECKALFFDTRRSDVNMVYSADFYSAAAQPRRRKSFWAVLSLEKEFHIQTSNQTVLDLQQGFFIFYSIINNIIMILGSNSRFGEYLWLSGGTMTLGVTMTLGSDCDSGVTMTTGSDQDPHFNFKCFLSFTR